MDWFLYDRDLRHERVKLEKNIKSLSGKQFFNLLEQL